jgi:hypothetical protein
MLQKTRVFLRWCAAGPGGEAGVGRAGQQTKHAAARETLRCLIFENKAINLNKLKEEQKYCAEFRPQGCILHYPERMLALRK